MSDNQSVVDYLNFLLAGELGARDQYFIHSEMYEEWQFGKLYIRIHHEMQDETEHAQKIIRRILLLGGTPKMQPSDINIGKDVPSMLQADLDLERKVQQDLKKGIKLCEEAGDYVSRQLLVEQLKDTEEDHAHWLEQQLRLIDLIGLQNYLQSQTSVE